MLGDSDLLLKTWESSEGIYNCVFGSWDASSWPGNTEVGILESAAGSLAWSTVFDLLFLLYGKGWAPPSWKVLRVIIKRHIIAIMWLF